MNSLMNRLKLKLKTPGLFSWDFETCWQQNFKKKRTQTKLHSQVPSGTVGVKINVVSISNGGPAIWI